MEDKNKIGNPIDRFLERIENWLVVPSYLDPDLQRKAEVVHTLTSAILVIALAIISITPFVFTNSTLGLSLTGGVILFCLIIQTLVKTGRVSLAVSLFVTVVWFFNTAVIVLSGGFHSQFLVSYITVTVMGGLILGNMYAYHFTGISIATYLLIYFLDNNGYIPEPIIHFTPIALIIINIVAIFLAATVLVMVLTKYEENFQDLTQKELSLSNINQKLNWEIKAREEAETLLKLSETRLRSALMVSPYPTMLHTDDGEILLVNTAWIESSGYSSQRLTTLEDWMDFLYRERKSEIEEIITQLVSGEQSHQEGHYELFTEQGTPISWYLRWTRLPDLPDGRNLILTMATDMTSLMEIESALRQSEENYSKYTLVTNDGLWDWDLNTDEVVFDTHFYTMAGYQVNEFPHQLEEFRKRIHPDDTQRVFQALDAHLNGETERFTIEFRFLQQDGGWLWVMGRGKIIEQDEFGNPLRFVGTHTDISAQKAIEEQLSQHQMHLEQIVKERTLSLNERISEVERLNAALTNILDDYQIANEKLTTLSQNLSATYQELESFTLSMSNDLQEPVHTIRRNADQLIKNTFKNLSRKELETLGEIHENATLVDQRINDLLNISKINRQEIRFKEIDTPALVKEVLKSFQKDLKKQKIELEVQDLPACLADEALLQQVFHNLVSNAIQFSTGSDQPKIIIGSKAGSAPDKAVFFVQDNGVGFKKEDREIIFQTFEQLETEPSYPGTGVGLTIAKLIINKHGGEIWAEAQEGMGATFIFELDRPPSASDGS